ncbi:MAG TPA: hypothetical protein VLE53_02655, partial [Gemmatimonadaceae bacterium]|nr:hypothetical protein [Gemmatimonadaceae bacterium]
DLNVLVLVDGVDMTHLRQEGAVARAWGDAGNPPPLTLTVEEWTGSADIFPMEYADILSYHRVLHGALPRDGVQVNRADLRLQLEHEARSKVLRLRHAILSAGAAPRAMAQLLADSASTMLVLLRAALRLAGEDPPADSFAMLDRVQAQTGLNVEVFRRVLRHRRGEAKLEGDAAVRAAEEYLAGATALARWVDQQSAGQHSPRGE